MGMPLPGVTLPSSNADQFADGSATDGKVVVAALAARDVYLDGRADTTDAAAVAHGAAGDPHPLYETSAEAAAKVTAHVAASDPHGDRARVNHTGTQLAATISNLAATVQAYTLNLFAAAAANVSLGGFKITNLANGSAASDAAAFGQIPTALPPNGAAGGDLSGSFPNPSVAKVNGVAVTGTPSVGMVPTATSGTAATWQAAAGGSTDYVAKARTFAPTARVR